MSDTKLEVLFWVFVGVIVLGLCYGAKIDQDNWCRAHVEECGR